VRSRSNAVAPSSAVVSGPHAPWPSTRVPRAASKLFANGSPTRRWSRLPQPLPSTSSPAQKAGLQSFDELPAQRGFLWVAFTKYTKYYASFPLSS
jgi:hypothetical protein